MRAALFAISLASRFLPPCVPDHVVVVINETEKMKPVELGKKLDFSSWLIAFDRQQLACKVMRGP